MNKQYRIEITAGIGKDRDGNDLCYARVSDALKTAEKLAVNLFGGVTQQSSNGAWKNAAGEIVREPSVTFVVVTGGDIQLADCISNYLVVALNQEAVLVTATQCLVEFVTQPKVEPKPRRCFK